MLVRRHRQGLQKAVGIFDETICLVCKPQIVLLAPVPLIGKEVDKQVFELPQRALVSGYPLEGARRALAWCRLRSFHVLAPQWSTFCPQYTLSTDSKKQRD